MNQEKGKTKYYILVEEIKDSILSGRVKAGEKLPSEMSFLQNIRLADIRFAKPYPFWHRKATLWLNMAGELFAQSACAI